MRLAFVDLDFAWPPPGGAQIDLVEVMRGLQDPGHEVHLFSPDYENVWRYGRVDESRFPLPVTQIAFPHAPPDPHETARKFREAVDAYQPDVVFLGFGAFNKVFVADALQHYPVISRYYMYEMYCLREFKWYVNYHPCSYSYLETPDTCRRCMAEAYAEQIRQGEPRHLFEEFMQCGGMSSAFFNFFTRQTRRYDAMIVYNEPARRRLLDYNEDVFVVPSGVHTDDFAYSPAAEKSADEKKVIFMSGRIFDPVKGFHVLRDACDLLAARRDDFELLITAEMRDPSRPWLKSAKWQVDPQALQKRYQAADISVVPSVWDEPFGIVALEAMAVGRPLVVSRVGGLQHIVLEGETGLLYDRHDEEALAACLEKLLNDAELRRRMGAAGRKRVEEHYDWKHVVPRHYPPILEHVTRMKA